MYVNPLFSNQLPYNKISSEFEYHSKLFLAIVCNSYDCPESFNKKDAL